MAISIYTTAELEHIASAPAKFISKKMAGTTAKQALLFRRNLQISLSAYSTRNPSRNGKLDPVQAGIIWVCRQIEMRAREAFMRHYSPRLWPEAQAKGMSKLTLKQELKKRWEEVLAKTGY